MRTIAVWEPRARALGHRCDGDSTSNLGYRNGSRMV